MSRRKKFRIEVNAFRLEVNEEGSVIDYVGVRVSGHIVVTVVAGLRSEINSE